MSPLGKLLFQIFLPVVHGSIFESLGCKRRRLGDFMAPRQITVEVLSVAGDKLHDKPLNLNSWTKIGELLQTVEPLLESEYTLENTYDVGCTCGDVQFDTKDSGARLMSKCSTFVADGKLTLHCFPKRKAWITKAVNILKGAMPSDKMSPTPLNFNLQLLMQNEDISIPGMRYIIRAILTDLDIPEDDVNRITNQLDSWDGPGILKFNAIAKFWHSYIDDILHESHRIVEVSLHRYGSIFRFMSQPSDKYNRINLSSTLWRGQDSEWLPRDMSSEGASTE